MSTSFSHFKLLYGRPVRGAMRALQELWTQPEETELQTAYQYVFDLQNNL